MIWVSVQRFIVKKLEKKTYLSFFFVINVYIKKLQIIMIYMINFSPVDFVLLKVLFIR